MGWSGRVARLVAAGVFAGGLAGCAVHEEVVADGEVVVARQPPPERGEEPGPAPGGEYVWIRGHWIMSGAEWTWRRGHWEARRAGFEWVPGHWSQRGGAWVWLEGHWQRI